MGLLGGFTLTPDFRPGFLEIGRWGDVSFGPNLSQPELVAHDFHSASYYRPAVSRPMLGAFAETHLTSRVSVRGSALFRQRVQKKEILSSAESLEVISGPGQLEHYVALHTTTVDRDSIWEFPVMVKYRFAALRGKATTVRPFFGAGPAFWIDSFRRPYNTRDPRYGAVAGIGFELQRKGWTLSPQANYTRWATDGTPVLYKNQVQIMIGFSF